MWNQIYPLGSEFDWEIADCRVISFVGGGGKTTLMDHWARVLAGRSCNVIVTTTTHLQIPQSGTLAFTMEDVHRLWMEGSYAVLGTVGNRRLSSPDESFLEEAMEQADFVLIEADGSKEQPCKVPNASEPVIHPDTDLVVAVLGMSAIGQPLIRRCFRLEELERFLGKSREDVLTESDAAQILSSPAGGRKGASDRGYVAVLNQCDTAERVASARRIAQLLRRKQVDWVLLTSFSEEERTRFEKGIGNA